MNDDAGVSPDVVDPEGSHQWDYPPGDRIVPDAHQIATTLAEERLRRELARLRGLGVDADGEVVAPNPVEQIRDSDHGGDVRRSDRLHPAPDRVPLAAARPAAPAGPGVVRAGEPGSRGGRHEAAVLAVDQDQNPPAVESSR